MSVFVLVLMMTSSSRKTTIFVIGDSTAAEKQWYKTSPERGCNHGKTKRATFQKRNVNLKSV